MSNNGDGSIGGLSGSLPSARVTRRHIGAESEESSTVSDVFEEPSIAAELITAINDNTDVEVGEIVVAVTSAQLSRDKPIGLIGVEEGVRDVSTGGYAEKGVETRKKTLNLTLVAGNFTWQPVILT